MIFKILIIAMITFLATTVADPTLHIKEDLRNLTLTDIHDKVLEKLSCYLKVADNCKTDYVTFNSTNIEVDFVCFMKSVFDDLNVCKWGTELGCNFVGTDGLKKKDWL